MSFPHAAQIAGGLFGALGHSATQSTRFMGNAQNILHDTNDVSGMNVPQHAQRLHSFSGVWWVTHFVCGHKNQSDTGYALAIHSNRTNAHSTGSEKRVYILHILLTQIISDKTDVKRQQKRNAITRGHEHDSNNEHSYAHLALRAPGELREQSSGFRHGTSLYANVLKWCMVCSTG